MMSNQDELIPRDKISKARIKSYLHFPFYGSLLAPLELVNKTDSNGIGSNGRDLIYSDKAINSLSQSELLYKLCVSVLHMALQHPDRGWHKNKELWGLACDYAVADILEQEHSSYLQRPISHPYNLVYRGKTAEQIYEMLDKGDEDSPSSGGGEQDEEGHSGCDHSHWEDTEDNEHDNSEVYDPYDWKEKVAQAAHIAKMQGKLPAGLESIIDEILNPDLDWRTILSNFIQQSAYHSNCRLIPPNKRHIWRDIYLPSWYSERLEVTVAIDTSGSISDTMLQAFAGEVKGIMEQYDEFIIHMIQCDAAVHSYHDITDQESDLPRKFIGRGGTDFRPVFQHIQDKKIESSCLIFFTDLYGTFPDKEPDYPVLWITTTKNLVVPFGYVIHLKKEDLDK